MGALWISVAASVVATTLVGVTTLAARPLIRRIAGWLREHREPEHAEFLKELSALWLRGSLAAVCVLLAVSIGWVLHQFAVPLLVWMGEVLEQQASAAAAEAAGPDRSGPVVRFLTGAESWPWQLTSAGGIAVLAFLGIREVVNVAEHGRTGARGPGGPPWVERLRVNLFAGLVVTLVIALPAAAVAGVHVGIDWGLSSPSVADLPPPPGLAAWELPWGVDWTVLVAAAALGTYVMFYVLDQIW